MGSFAEEAAVLYPPPGASAPSANLPEGNNPVLVVGIISDEACGMHSTMLADAVVALPAFQQGSAMVPTGTSGVLLFYDAEHCIIYIVVSSQLQNQSFEQATDALLSASIASNAHSWAACSSQDHARALLLAFHLCHVLIHVSDGSSLSLQLLRSLRLLHALKQNISASVTSALRAAAPSARAAQPQLPPAPVLGLVLQTPWAVCGGTHPPRRGSHGAAAAAPSERFEAAAEAQARALLASSKQLMRAAMSSGGLFALHAATCVHACAPMCARPVGEHHYTQLLQMLAHPAGKVDAHHGDATGQTPRDQSAFSSWLESTRIEESFELDNVSQETAAVGVRRFIAALGQTAGCTIGDDGLLAVSAQARGLPCASAWSAACATLLERVFAHEAEDDAEAGRFGRLGPKNMRKAMDLEYQFSSSRCAVVTEAAREKYMRDLPLLYTRDEHEARLRRAEELLRSSACGPALCDALERLRHECLVHWQDGRMLCDARSVTGRRCVLAAHALPDDAGVAGAGIAAASGLLQVGDVLVSVNGESAVGHAPTTAMLKRAEGEIKLVVERRPHADADAQTLSLTLHKPNASAKLGIVLTSATATSGTPKIAGLGPATRRPTSFDARPHCSRFVPTLACRCGRAADARADAFDLNHLERLFTCPSCDGAEQETVAFRHAIADGATVSAMAMPNALPEPNTCAQLDPTALRAAPRCTARLFVLGRASAYDTAEGMLQPGFLARHNLMNAVSVDAPSDDGDSSTQGAAPSASSKPKRDGAPNPGSVSLWQPPPTLTVHVGCEYECAAGHRFFADVRGATSSVARPPLRAALAEPLRVATPCVADSCALAAQLQRLFVRTPDASSFLSLAPRICFRASPRAGCADGDGSHAAGSTHRAASSLEHHGTAPERSLISEADLMPGWLLAGASQRIGKL